MSSQSREKNVGSVTKPPISYHSLNFLQQHIQYAVLVKPANCKLVLSLFCEASLIF